MKTLNKTIIIRHKRENLKKCSLRGLESREDFQFLTYPDVKLPDLSQTIVLSVDAPPLEERDASMNLLLIDATWRLAAKIEKVLYLDQHPLRRSLPGHFKTAYPRRQDDCPDPTRGLASIEALFVAFQIFKKEAGFLLENYHWKSDFITKNNGVLL